MRPRRNSITPLRTSCCNTRLVVERVGNKEEAVNLYEESLAIRKKLATDNPAVTRYVSDLAASHNHPGIGDGDRRLVGEKTEATPAQKLQLVVKENVEAARDGGHARV